MTISIIAAMGNNRVIGRSGALPWHIPEDLRRFRELTFGHTVIMGRRTFEAIGRPLPGRKNVIVTRQPSYSQEGAVIACSLDEAVKLSGPAGEIFVCGGGEIYRQALPLCTKIFLTVVDLDPEGDTFFPLIPADDFREVSRETISESPPAQLILFERITPVSGALAL